MPRTLALIAQAQPVFRSILTSSGSTATRGLPMWGFIFSLNPEPGLWLRLADSGAWAGENQMSPKSS